jgi:hypothetical protein
MGNMRLILCANSTSKIIAPIRSRCLLVRVAAPTEEQVCTPNCKNVADDRDEHCAQSCGEKGEVSPARRGQPSDHHRVSRQLAQSYTRA